MVKNDLTLQMTENPYDLKLKMSCKDNINNLRNYFFGGCFPQSIEIFPTNKCNLNCSFCIDKQYKNNDELDINTLKLFLNQYEVMGGRAITWAGGGEPTQYPHIKEAIEYANELGLKQGMMTNGTFPEDMIDVIGNNMVWIRVSLDTTDKETYKKSKGVEYLERVKRNIEELKKYPVKVNVNVNLAPEFVHYIYKTAEDSKSWGADVFQLRPLLPCPADNRVFIPHNLYEIIRKVKSLEDESYFLSVSYDKFNEMKKPRTYESCKYHNFIFVLNANGDVSVCAYRLYEDDFVFGNIKKQSLNDIWYGEKRKQVIKNTTNMDFSKCQVCCKGHELNKYIHCLELANNLKDKDFL